MTQRTGPRSNSEPSQTDELREFLIVVRRALLMVARWIEKRYQL